METQLFQEIYKKIQEARYIVLLTHKNPDPDTIGSALALGSYLKNEKKKYKILNTSKIIPTQLSFLNGFDKITDQLPKSFDLVIYLDCSNDTMVGINIDKDIFSIVIDHHQTSEEKADINLIDSTSGSTGEIVYDFFLFNKISITQNIAQALYVSIYSDTVGFTTSKTTAKTFEKITNLVQTGIDPSFIANNLLQKDSLAKYRALPKVLETLELHFGGNIATIYCEEQWVEQSGVELYELDFVSNMVLNIAIVHIVAYFRKVDNKIRVSLRGKGDLDLSEVALNFHGGGHKNASGFNLQTQNIQKAKEQFLNHFKNHTFD